MTSMVMPRYVCILFLFVFSLSTPPVATSWSTTPRPLLEGQILKNKKMNRLRQRKSVSSSPSYMMYTHILGSISWKYISRTKCSTRRKVERLSVYSYPNCDVHTVRCARYVRPINAKLKGSYVPPPGVCFVVYDVCFFCVQAVDMWSLGVIFYTLIGGYHPFHDERQTRLFRRIRDGSFMFHEELWDGVSGQAKVCVSRAAAGLVVSAGGTYDM